MEKIHGNAYLCVPRNLLKAALNGQQEARVHLVLFLYCNYADGEVLFGKRMVSCRRGEWIGTYRQLAELAGVHLSITGKLLQKLADKKLINITRIEGGTSIYLNGYDEFTSKEGKKERQKKEKKPKLSPMEYIEEYGRRLAEGIVYNI
ncbi:MAG: hypothetical protein LBQ78_06015 [Tannerellaceae bacterium]|nr:hypothetical protein [Tannerellaceae bacterium]